MDRNLKLRPNRRKVLSRIVPEVLKVRRFQLFSTVRKKQSGRQNIAGIKRNICEMRL